VGAANWARASARLAGSLARSLTPSPSPRVPSQNAIDRQARKEERAAVNVERAQDRLGKAQGNFDAFVARKGGPGGPGPIDGPGPVGGPGMPGPFGGPGGPISATGPAAAMGRSP
jgi:hypothetical protein